MTIQVELIYSLVIMVCLGVFFVYAGKKVALADPTVKPKGIVLVVETGVKAIDDYMKSIMPKKFAKNYYPYFAMVFCYILVSNLSSLIGFESPTSNYSITFAMTFITFILIQYNALKKKGFFKYVWDTVWPPTNILSVLSPLISIGPIIAPVFHCYFDIFAGCIQTLVFVTLSSILIMMENEDDE